MIRYISIVASGARKKGGNQEETESFAFKMQKKYLAQKTVKKSKMQKKMLIFVIVHQTPNPSRTHYNPACPIGVKYHQHLLIFSLCLLLFYPNEYPLLW